MLNFSYSLPDYVTTVISKLEHCGYEAYAVGGCVRDMLMGKEPDDFDVCTNALPQQMLTVFADFKIIETGLKHGTVTVVIENNHVEITTYRIDGNYIDNRHPENVEFTSRLKDDLVRRDFTINAMVYCPSKGIIDYFGGVEDLKNKIIRCVGNADERFNEDALRIMRAIRFASVLGFEIHKDTHNSILKNTPLLKNISAERKATELNKLLCGKDVCRILMQYASVICHIIPPLCDCVGLDQKSPHHIYDVYTHTVESIRHSDNNLYIRLALLLHDVGKPACMTIDDTGRGHFYGHPEISAAMTKEVLSNLKYDNHTIKLVTTLVKYHDRELPKTPKAAKRLLNTLTLPVFEMFLKVTRADRLAHSEAGIAARMKEVEDCKELVDEIIAKQQCFSLDDMAFDGKDLIALGLKPGPKIGYILNTLLAEIMDEQLPNEKPLLTDRAKQLINQSEG